MIRVACALVLLSLATLLAMITRTEASTAIAFSFVGHGTLALALGLYAYYLWGPVRMRPEERGLYDLAFASLEPREFLNLVALGTWEDASPGERIISTGERPDHLRVLLSGKVSWKIQGGAAGELAPGQLIGSAIVVAQEPSRGEAVAVEPCRMLSWNIKTVELVLDKKPRVRAALQAIVSQDLARKVQTLTSA